MKTGTPSSRPARRTVRFLVRQLTRLVAGLLLTALCLLAWLYLVGVPEPGRARLIRCLNERRIPVHFDGLELDFPFDVRFDNLRWTSDEEAHPFPVSLEAEQLSIRISPLQAMLKKSTDTTISLTGFQLQMPESTPPTVRQTIQTFHLKEAELRLTGKTAEIRRFSLEAVGCQLVGSGKLVLPEPGRPPQEPQTPEPLHLLFNRLEPRLQALLKQTARLRFQHPPQGTLHFELDLNRPQEARLKGRVRTGPFFMDMLPFQELTADIKLESGIVSMEKLELTHSGGTLTGSGTWSATDPITALTASSTLPWPVWRAFLPAPTLRLLDENQVTAQTLFLELAAGPAPAATLFNQAALRARIGRLQAGGLTAEDLSVQVDKSDSVLSVSKLTARISGPDIPEERTGPVSGEGRIDLARQTFHAGLQLNFDPLPLCRWLPPNVREEVELFAFHGPAPDLALELTGGWTGASGTVSVSGLMSAEHLSYRGVPLDHLAGRLTAGKRFLEISDLEIGRPEGTASAQISADFEADTVRFEVQSTLNPAALAQLIDDHLARALALFDFQGPAEISAAGLYDYGSGMQTDLEGTFICRNTVLPEAHLDTLSGTTVMQGNRLLFHPLEAQLHEGTAEGRLKFDFSRRETVPAQMQLALHRIDFDRWYAFQHPEQPPLQEMGFFHGSAWLEFDAARTDWKQTLSGTGWVRLQEGLLVDLPLIGRFSELARWIDAEFSLLSQNNFSMGFDLQDGILYSNDARLDGTLLSLSGTGQYDLPADQLDFRVQMRPFRDTARLTRLAQTLSAPASRLLSFRLTGPLEDPQWNFTHLSPAALADALRRLGDSLVPPFIFPSGQNPVP